MNFLENVDRTKLQKSLIVIISVLTVIALALLLVIIIASVSDGLSNDLSNVELKDYTVTDKDLKTGSLILADSTHHYSVEAELLDLVNCKEYMMAQSDYTGPQTDGVDPAKNYIPWQDMRFSKTAMAAAHKMLTDAKNAVDQNKPLTIDAAYDKIMHGETTFEYNTAMLMLLSDYTSGTNTRVPMSEAYREWFDNNAAKYGFIESFEDGYRYVGTVHAKYMTEKNLSLAEYIDYLKKNTGITKSLSISLDGAEYAVYYVACENAGEIVKVPAKGDITVSGTNEGGLIITCKTK